MMDKTPEIPYKEGMEPAWWLALNRNTFYKRTKEFGNKMAFIGNHNILTRLFGRAFQATKDEMMEYKSMWMVDKDKVKKAQFGRLVGKIPMADFILNPKLQYDPKEQDKYFREHSQFKAPTK